LRSGVVLGSAEPTCESDRGAAVLLDGQQSVGLSTGVLATDLACERARRHGVGLVAVRNSSHLGCLGYFSERAALRGMIGIASSNCGAQRIAPPPGGLAPMLGTNPISVGAPAGSLPPFVLDMSTTVVATSRIREAARRGEQVPRGWLVSKQDGALVTDPNEFMEGRADVAFLGGEEASGSFKGYGLALAVEVMCGLLGGAAVSPAKVSSDGSSDRDIGHFFLCIDPAALRRKADYDAQAQAMFQALLDCPAREGAKVRYPGLPEHERRLLSDAEGIALDRPIYDDLLDLARRIGAHSAPEALS
jgi:LDH2 family malate/lactate/ureidoglycolate dehydrogenase